MVFKKTLLEFIFHQRKRESAFQDMGKPIKKNAELNYLWMQIFCSQSVP